MRIMRTLGVAAVALAISVGTTPAAGADSGSARWQQPTTKVCVDSTVPARWGVAAAIRNWNRAPETPDLYRSSHCAGPTVTIRLGHLDGTPVGITWTSSWDPQTLAGARIVLDPDNVKRYARHNRRCVRHFVAAHELGHALGLRHYTDSHGGQVMSYLGWKRDCGRPTGGDFRDLAALYRR